MPRYSVAVVAKPEPKLEKSNFSNFARKYFRHTSQWCIFLEQEVREKCHAFETRELSCACRSCHVDHFVCRLRRSDECGRGHRHQQLCCLSPITKLQNEKRRLRLSMQWCCGGLRRNWVCRQSREVLNQLMGELRVAGLQPCRSKRNRRKRKLRLAFRIPSLS